MDKNEIDQAMILIRHWLHEKPSEDFKEFTGQVAGALWMEERFFKTLAGLFKDR